MNRYLPIVSSLGIITAITLQPQAVLALEPAEIYAKAKEFTVQIDGEETGTGTIIDRNNNIYTVITCWHVMDTPGNYQVTTPDGNTHQVTKVKNLPDIDLAIITFNASNSYPIAELGDSTQATSGLDAYVVGYPDPFPGVPERQYFADSAEIQTRLSQGENGYQIIHDGSFTPGSSGGGIFDSEARLIGINGQFISEGNTGKAYGTGVPLELYLAARGNFATPTNVLPPQDFVSIGKRKLKQGEYKAAITEFDRALAGDADNITLLMHRGASYAQIGEYDRAIADLNEAISLNPQNPYAYNLRGASYAKLGEYDRAIADLNEAISLNPQNGYAYTFRGASYFELKEYDRAIADLNEAISLNPQHAYSYYFRGASYAQIGEYDRAIADLNEAISLNPQVAKAYYARGVSYVKLKEYDRAIADLNEAISLNPQHAYSYYFRGVAYDEIGETSKAKKDYEQAANLFQE